MKKIIYLFAFAGLLWSCDPMDDTYKNLDEAQVPYKEKIEYTLVKQDYTSISKVALTLCQNGEDSASAKLINSQQAFNTRFPANDLVGGILSTYFPALNRGSAAVVTYNVNLEDLGSIASIAAATQVSINDADYTAIGGQVGTAGYFIPSNTGDENIPALLASKLPEATANTYAIVNYKQSDNEPSVGGGGDTPVFSGFTEDFNAVTESLPLDEAFPEWTLDIAAGSKNWKTKTYSENTYIQASAFGAEDSCIIWAISPNINLTGATSPALSFDVCFGYVAGDALTVWISDNYTDDASTATWTELTQDFDLSVGLPSGGSYGTLTNCGTSSLSSYIGKNVRIGFKYSGGTTVTTTVQVDNVSVQDASKGTRADLFKVYNDVYMFNGTAWKKSSDIRAIHQFEYLAMGQTYGNFSSSAPAENYLPAFLAATYPYANEGDSKIVVYKYYSGSTQYRATKYNYVGGVWNPYSGIVTKSEQYVHTGSSWIFDPTVKISPSSSDMQLLVDWVYTNLSRTYGSSYGNDEFYFGASAYYVNFDLRLSNKGQPYFIPGYDGLSVDEAIALTWSRLEEGIVIMLGLKYPEAVTEIAGGIPVYYWFTFNTYENDLTKNEYTGIFQFTSNNKFERILDEEDAQVAAGNLKVKDVDWNR